MTNSSFCNVKHKSSVSNAVRPEIEDGFVIKFVEYDFPIQNERTNVHNYEELIKSLVNQSLDRGWE